MNRRLLAFLTAILVAGPFAVTFADSPKFAVSLDLGPTAQTLINTGGFGIGASFEFAFLDSFSLVPQFTYSTFGKADAYTNNIIPGAQIRLYPVSQAITGFWLAAGFNYAIISGSGISNNNTVSVVLIDIGYKWVFTGDKGLFIEPYAGYGLVFADTRTIGTWDYGVSLGLCF